MPPLSRNTSLEGVGRNVGYGPRAVPCMPYRVCRTAPMAATGDGPPSLRGQAWGGPYRRHF
jgi:hypothetical protein